MPHALMRVRSLNRPLDRPPSETPARRSSGPPNAARPAPGADDPVKPLGRLRRQLDLDRDRALGADDREVWPVKCGCPFAASPRLALAIGRPASASSKRSSAAEITASAAGVALQAKRDLRAAKPMPDEGGGDAWHLEAEAGEPHALARRSDQRRLATKRRDPLKRPASIATATWR